MDLGRACLVPRYVSSPEERKERLATVGGLAIEPASTLTAALTLVAPKGAGPGDSYRFNVVQRHGRRVVGGSTYVLAVTAPDQRESA